MNEIRNNGNELNWTKTSVYSWEAWNLGLTCEYIVSISRTVDVSTWLDIENTDCIKSFAVHGKVDGIAICTIRLGKGFLWVIIELQGSGVFRIWYINEEKYSKYYSKMDVFLPISQQEHDWKFEHLPWK